MGAQPARHAHAERAAQKKTPVAAQIKFCAVKLSDIQSHGLRLEASVYDLDAMKVRRDFLKNSVPLSELISNAYYGGRLKRQYINGKNNQAIGFVGSSEMLDCRPKPVKFMMDSFSVDDLKVTIGSLLISRSGTVGNITFVNKTLSKFLVSEHAIRLICKDYAGYLYAYLKSKIGQLLIQSNIYGAVIQEIEPEHLENIPVPVAPESLKRQIHGLVVRSYELRDESNELIDEAEKILINELHLPDIDDFEREKVFSVKLSDLRGRLDASYHLPLVGSIVEHLKAHAAEVTTIADPRISRAVILPGRFKRVYVDEGHGRIFIGGKQIGELDPSNKKYLSNIHHADRISAELELHENMTLITRSGTIGKVTLVPKHWEDWIASEHVIRITPASDDISGYLSLFLASDCGQVLIKRNTYGAVVDEIDDKQVRVLPVPLLRNVATQSRINSMVLLANEKRFRAYLLEQEALRILNDKILAVQ